MYAYHKRMVLVHNTVSATHQPLLGQFLKCCPSKAYIFHQRERQDEESMFHPIFQLIVGLNNTTETLSSH